MLRHPGRFNLMVMLCLAMVAGLACADLARRLRGRAQAVYEDDKLIVYFVANPI